MRHQYFMFSIAMETGERFLNNFVIPFGSLVTGLRTGPLKTTLLIL